MKTIGTAFAILTGGLMITGMFIAGVVCGAGIMVYGEKREKNKHYYASDLYTVNYRHNHDVGNVYEKKEKNDEDKSES